MTEKRKGGKKEVIIMIILFLLSIVTIYEIGDNISQFMLDKLYESHYTIIFQKTYLNKEQIYL